MILIISTNSGEPTTNIVCEYLEAAGQDFYRLNMESVFNEISNISISNLKEKIVDLLGTDDILVWFRRGYILNTGPLFEMDHDKLFTYNLVDQLTSEIQIWQSWFVKSLQSLWPTVNDYQNITVNKLEVLSMAKEIGLKIPETFITENLDFVESWLTQKSRLITKPISEIQVYQTEEDIYRQITKEITLVDVKALRSNQNKIMISLFQEYISKKGDIRIFYLNGKCYSVLLITDETSDSKIDGRNFDINKPIRMVPIVLPEKLIERITKLNHKLKLETCSIDFVLGEDDEYYFLEVNPVGQFGWISGVCGANLHAEFANYLIEKHNEKYIS